MKEQFLISKVFTIPYFDSLYDKESIPDSLRKCIKRYVYDTDELTYGKAISQIYEYMDDEYRNEYYYKNTILNQLLIRKHNIANTAALTELPVAKSKADIVMINGKGIVYEIKTDLDNFSRLENQINDYYKVFSYVNVVVSGLNFNKIKELFKESDVGIYELTKNGNVFCRKKAVCNNSFLSYEAMFQMLRKKEFETIIYDFYKDLPRVSDFEYYRECFNLFKCIDLIKLQKKVMKILKQRTVLSIEDAFEDYVPRELSYYVYFSKKYRSNYDELTRFLDKKVEV